MQLTLEPGASVAEVARAHGVNANQVFKWRRAFERGELIEPCTALLPVTVTTPARRRAMSRRNHGESRSQAVGRFISSFPGER